MCYAVPGRIVRIDSDVADVDYGGVRKRVNVMFIDSPKAGEYVLVHAGFAIEKIDKSSAQETLKLIEKMMSPPGGGGR
jgi:hydrogenase expression/formation protein HypC